MDKKKQKLSEAMTEKTGKKVMKRVRTGQWVTALMFGLLMVGSAPVVVSAEEQTQEQEVEIEEVSEQATVVSADPSDAIMWIANKPEQVATEIEKQSDEKDQDPLSDYTIVWGDTLWAISLATGTTVEELAEINNIENLDLIYAGDLLRLADGTVVGITPEQNKVAVEQNSTQQEDEQVTVEETTSEEQKQVTQPTQTDQGGTETVVEDMDKEEVKENKVDDKEEVKDKEEVEVEVDKKEDEDTNKEEKVEEDKVDEKEDGDTDSDEEPTPEPEPTPNPEEDLEDVEKEVVNPETGVEVEETEPEVIPDDSVEVEVEEPTETPVVPEEDPVVDVTDPEVQEPGDEEQEVIVTTQVETITEKLGNEIIRRGTNELPVGEERVVQEGSFGQRVKKFLITFHDGVQFGDRELIQDEVVLAPVDKIVEFGTHVEQKPVITTSTRTETENLPFERVTIGNTEMWKGDTKVVQTGSFGKVVREYKVTYSDGVEVSAELINETRTESVNEVIHLGTKPEVSTKTRTEKETVAFGTEKRNNANLLEGQTRVAQEGVNGERTITYEQTYIRGKFDSEKQVSSEITKQPVNKIIEVGTKKKPVITTDTRTVTQDIKYDVKVIEVSNLPVGQEKVVVEGRNGQRNIVYKQTFEDGVLVNEELLSNTVTRAPVTKVVHLGVGQDNIVLNQQVFSQELLNLVNELRVSVGVHKLTYDNTLQQGTNIRAREASDVFSHTRPDGSHYITAFGYKLPNYYLGENLAYNYIFEGDNGVDTLERYMAKTFFNQYYNSAGHYENMISDRYVTFATGVTLEKNNKVTNAQIFGTKNR